MSSSRHVRPPHDKSKVQLLCYLHTVTILVPLVSYFLENAMVGFRSEEHTSELQSQR